MAHRYFTKDIQENRACITGNDARHLAQVLRAEAGQPLILCDGQGTDYKAVITHVAADRIEAEVFSRAKSSVEPSVWAEVALGYARGERLEWAIQKSVELGASVIRPFFSARCVVKPKKEEEKNRRYTRIAEEAAKQCGRGILPVVAMPVLFEELIKTVTEQCGQSLFFYESGGASLRSVLKEKNKVALITGPEGGFSPEEAALAVQYGCHSVGLGPRILRSETAPAAALAALMTLTGNLE